MTCRVAIIGAGPYGLAAAAHLRAANVETHVFGQPMCFWEQQMPAGMFLRSPVSASHISDPGDDFTLDRYSETEQTPLSKPIPLRRFVEYGRWFQSNVVPDLDRRRVERVERIAGRFCLTLEDGDAIEAERVVIAAGISRFAHRPAEFDRLSPDLVTHSADETDLGRYAGRRTVVIGGGQSAFETAALLRDGGAEVEIIVRRREIHFLDQRMTWLKSDANPVRGLLYPPTDVGPPGLNLIAAAPDVFRRIPRSLQGRIAQRCIRPAGAAWLRPRLAGVPISTGRAVASVSARGGQVHLTLDDGSTRCADHVVLATGYRVDVSRYPFLAPSLLSGLDVVNGYPVLARGFEASVPGLHFLGAPGARSFGPLCRFVAGTRYAARAVTACIVRDKRYTWGPSPQPLPAA